MEYGSDIEYILKKLNYLERDIEHKKICIKLLLLKLELYEAQGIVPPNLIKKVKNETQKIRLQQSKTNK